MGKLQEGRPSPGTVMGAVGMIAGLIALIVSLSASAAAQPSRTLIHKGQIAPGAVTARALAHGAVRAAALGRGSVTSKALSRGAVTAAALAKHAVGTEALADDAVDSDVLAPGSVYGGALGAVTTHLATIKDEDAIASNPEWTASSSGVAKCAPGERLLSTGFAFTNPGNREAAFLSVVPISAPNENDVLGRITTNSGGTAEAEVTALCLK